MYQEQLFGVELRSEADCEYPLDPKTGEESTKRKIRSILCLFFLLFILEKSIIVQNRFILKNNKSEKEAGQKLYENNTGIH